MVYSLPVYLLCVNKTFDVHECLHIYSYASMPWLVSFLQFQFIRKLEHVFRAVFHTLLNRFLSRPLWHDSEQSLSGWDSPPD